MAQKIFFGARTRILSWYFVLITFTMGMSILALRSGLSLRLEQRIQKSLLQEVEEFRQLAAGKNPNTGQPFGEDVAEIFELFLYRNIPDDDEFLLTLRNGQLYKSSPRALPKLLQRDSDLVNHLAQLTQPEQGKKIIPDDTIVYLAEPLKIVSVQGVKAAGISCSCLLGTSGSKDGADDPVRAARQAWVKYSKTFRFWERRVVTTVSMRATKRLPA